MQDSREPLLGSHLVERTARWGVVAWSLIGVAILAFWSYRYLVYPIRVVFPPLIVATVIVFLLNPLVTRLERGGVPRVWGTLLTYVVLLSIVGIGLTFLVPVVSRQVTELVEQVPSLLATAQRELAALSESISGRVGFEIGGANLVEQLEPEGRALEYAGRITSITLGVLNMAIVFLIGPIIAFYLLVDLPKLGRAATVAIPARRRVEVLALQERIGAAVGGFFRGQLIVSALVGLSSMLGLYVIGLPYWAPVGLIAGLFNLIPFIGPIIGAIPALFVAFTVSRADAGLLFHPEPGWPLALSAAAVLIIVQQIDSYVVSPKIVGRTVRLHPLTVMLSVLAGGTILGLWGMLFAVPLVASAKILVMHAWDTRTTWPPPGAEASAGDGGREEGGGDLGEPHTAPAERGWSRILARIRRRGRGPAGEASEGPGAPGSSPGAAGVGSSPRDPEREG